MKKEEVFVWIEQKTDEDNNRKSESNAADKKPESPKEKVEEEVERNVEALEKHMSHQK